MEFDNILFWRLLIAIPEWEFDEQLIDLLKRHGVIRWDAMHLGEKINSFIAKDKAMGRKMRDASVIERIMMIMPEVLSVKTVDWLRREGLISVEIAHALRVGLRAKDALIPVFVGKKTFAARVGILLGDLFSEETIDFLRDLDQARINRMAAALRMTEVEKEIWLTEFLAKETERLKKFNFDFKLSRADREYLDRVRKMTRLDIEGMRNLNTSAINRSIEISIARAEMAKVFIRRAKVGYEAISGIRRTIAEIKAANGAWDTMTVVWNKVLSEKVLFMAMRAGVISEDRFNAIRSLEVLGLDVWKKIGKSFNYESWAARALMVSEGVLSHEMVEALYQNGLIREDLYRLLHPAVNEIRKITRSLGARYRKGERMRLIPAENPLGTFLRRTEAIDRSLLRLLAEASQDASKTASKMELSALVGNKARAAQQRLIAKELNDAILRVYEQIGYITIFGEKKAALAAADAMDTLTGPIWGTTKKMQDLNRVFIQSSRSGIESYVSRQENLLQLSRRIYNGGAHAQGVIEREISKALLRDLSAKEFAKIVESFFKPGVPGGMSYAAMRLARTEINNAFHFTQIRYTREMPWVQGYKWNRSGRGNSRCGICGDYANNDGYDMGKGVWPKSEAPGKPHPQCLCYLTTVTMSNGDFEKRLRSGAFDRYFQEVEKSGFFADAWNVERRNILREYAPILGETARTAALGQIASIVRATFSR